MKKLLIAILFMMPALAFAQLYHVGDVVYSPANEKAVVFYVFDDGNHGWAVSLNDHPQQEFWTVASAPASFQVTVTDSTVSSYAAYLEDVDTWRKIKDFRNHIDSINLSTYVLYPALFNLNFEGGWYLPSAGQMRKLYSSKLLIFNALRSAGGYWLQPRKYWTATTANSTHPITINGREGKVEPTFYDQAYYIRPIRNIGFVSNTEKDSYYCRGDKVTDLGNDFIAENDTVLSRTYKSYQGFDSIVAVNVHVLEPQYEVVGNMLVCMGSDAEISVNHGEGTFNYSWMDEQNGGTLIGSNNSLTLTNVNDPHQYSVSVGQFFNIVNKYCTDNTMFDISVIETDVPINGEGVVCYNTPGFLTVPESEGLQYTWYQGSSSNIIGTGNNLTTPNLTSSATYNVSVSGGACTGTGSITINVAPEFSVSVSGDNTTCYGGNAELLATPSNPERVTYQWFNSSTNEYVGNQNTLTSPNLYYDSQFAVNAIKTSGPTPTASDIQEGDIITSNNIVVRPAQWATAMRHNLEAVGVVYHISSDSVRIVGLDEYDNIPWGSSRTTEQYAATVDIARTKMNGKAMTDIIAANNNSQSSINYVAALKAREKGEAWYLPAAGEMYAIGLNLANINYGLSVLEAPVIGNDINSYYWTVTEKDANRAWCAVGAGTTDEAKSYSHKVRPVTAMNISNLILFRNSTTCRASDTYNISILPLPESDIYDTIMLGQTYSYRDSTMSFSDIGDFFLQWSFHNDYGCDSVFNISLHVKPMTVTITPFANQHKTCGQNDPEFQYNLSVNISDLTGELSREDGETVGSYAYTTGTLNAGELYEFVIAENSPMFEILPKYREISATRCDSYTWGGNIYTESGDYTRTFVGNSGCDSIVTLHLTINYTQDTTFIDTTVCSYYVWQNNIWGNQTFYSSGEYTRSFPTAHCDSIVTLRLTVASRDTTHIYEEACDYYEYNNNNYYFSGNYSRHFVSQIGCDSIVTLHLTIYMTPADPQVSTTANTLCSGGYNGTIEVTSPLNNEYEYSIDGVNFQSSPLFTGVMEGDYTVTVRNGFCAKTIETSVETTAIRPDVVLTVSSESVCEGETISFNSQGSSSGSEYVYLWTGPGVHSSLANFSIEDAFIGNSGEYILTISNTNTGCNRSDSVYVAVHSTSYGIDEVSACDSYTWINGNTYTESTNTPTYTLTNANGCDSIVTLHLTLLHSVSSSDGTTICPSELPYEYNGHTFNEAGTYNVSLPAANGCDSIVTFTLNVYEGYSETINVDVCEYDMPYTFGDNLLTEAGSYTYTYPGSPCDSVVTVNIAVHERPTVTVSQAANGNEITLTASGAYTYEWETGETSSFIIVFAANDTISVVGYSEYQCADTAYAIIDDLSPIENVQANISVYPIPSNGTIFVEGDNIEEVEIVDMVGRIIHRVDTFGSRAELKIDVPSGEYVLRIKVGENILQKKILIAK